MHTLLTNKLDLKQQCWDLFYVVTLMHIYLLIGNIHVNNNAAEAADPNNRNRKVILKTVHYLLTASVK